MKTGYDGVSLKDQACWWTSTRNVFLTELTNNLPFLFEAEKFRGHQFQDVTSTFVIDHVQLIHHNNSQFSNGEVFDGRVYKSIGLLVISGYLDIFYLTYFFNCTNCNIHIIPSGFRFTAAEEPHNSDSIFVSTLSPTTWSVLAQKRRSRYLEDAFHNLS